MTTRLPTSSAMTSNNAWNAGLTAAQEHAVIADGQHVCLLAGPGTGKTRVIVSRVLYLIQCMGVDPGAIVLLTFTRAAAAELRARLASSLGHGSTLPHVSTLHSYALSTLMRNDGLTMLPVPVRIADDWEESEIVTHSLAARLNMTPSQIKDLLAAMSSDWVYTIRSETARSVSPDFVGALNDDKRVLGYTLRSELVYRLGQALAEGMVPDSTPAHLCVDEYQDLNPCDLEVIERLCSHGAVLYVSGDDDQSIYGFRNADPKGIREFDRYYQPAQGVRLEECKRCDRLILELARYVAGQDTRRIPKELYADSELGDGQVLLWRFDNLHAEAQAVADTCAMLVRQGVPADDILVLVRSDKRRAYSEPLAASLQQRGLSHSIATNPLEVFNCPKGADDRLQTEGRRFMSLLRLVSDPQDSLAWASIALLENGISHGTVAEISEFSAGAGIRFGQAVLRIANDPSLLVSRSRILRACAQQVHSTLEQIAPAFSSSLSEGLAALADEVITDPGVRDSVSAVLDPIVCAGRCTDVSDLLQALSASLDEAEQDARQGAVNIMTMHQAKGLTKGTVIIVGVEQELLPGHATAQREIDDARRLLYVSITRAQHRLIMTHCRFRGKPQLYTGSHPGHPARNLTEFLRGGPVQSQSYTPL